MVASPAMTLSPRPQVVPERAADSLEARLRFFLSSGGDERLWPDRGTGRNRYGAPAGLAQDELWLSSSTASAISPLGWSAAMEALDRLLRPGCGLSPTIFFDEIRARLLRLYGVPGSEAVLAPSGTEAELVTLRLGLALAQGPVVNILTAPAESGSGVPAAALGRHFLHHASAAGPVSRGERLDGWEAAQISCEAIEIRTACGRLRPEAEVDEEAALTVERAVRAGAFALLHVMDASKTGRRGVSRSAAQAIARRRPGRVLVAVDACQLRCSSDQARADLEAGFAVMLTGSKFAGGPPFSGAVLLPAPLAEELKALRPTDLSLAAYSSALDWPPALRASFAGELRAGANLGLGLRWAAALAEMEAFESLWPAQRETILAAFDHAVRRCVAADGALALLDEAEGGAPGLTPVVHTGDVDARRVYEALRRPADPSLRPCHLGQPVEVAGRAALRVCASMPMVVSAAVRGVQSLEADVAEAFEGWAAARRRLG
jgi:hypothetical protein